MESIDHYHHKKIHGTQRLLERYGIILSSSEYDDIVEDIVNYNPPPIYIEEDGNSFHLLNIKGTDVIFLFDWKDRVIVTTYYKSWFKQNKDGTWSKNKKLKAKYRRSTAKRLTFHLKTGLDFHHYI